MKPRYYQQDCLDAIATAIEQGENKALIVMAPSLGKTVTSAFAIQNFFESRPWGRVLYLCHINEVLCRVKDEYKKVFGNEYSYGFYNGVAKDGHKTDFTFASFQTMTLHKEDFRPNEFDYVVVDEAHHAKADTYEEVVRYFKPAFLLGLTATPTRLDGRNLEELFNPAIYTMDLPNAIANKLVALIDYRLMVDEVMELDHFLVDGIDGEQEQISIAELNKRIFLPKRDEEIVQLIHDRICDRENPRMMIFCCSIEHAENISKLIPGSKIVHSKIASDVCHERVQAFRRGEFGTIISVDQLNEGVDIPQADVVVFLRSTVSPVVYYQQLGRGLRTHADKDDVLVLDFVRDLERFEMIWEFEQAIRENLRNLNPGEVNATEEDSLDEVFRLNIDSDGFRETMVDIVDFVSRIREENERHFWTKEEAIAALQVNFTKDNPPTQRKINALSRNICPCVNAIVKSFGSFNAALVAAGFDINKKDSWTEEEAIVALWTNFTDNNPPTEKKVDALSRNICPSVAVFIRLFGSFNAALVAAGFDIYKRGLWTKEKAIIALQANFTEDNPPTKKKINALSRNVCPSTTVFRRLFGSFNATLVAAGFDVNRSIRSWTKEELITALQSNFTEDNPPTMEKVNALPRNVCPSTTVFRRLFGSFNATLVAAGFDVNRSIRSWTKEELITALQSNFTEDNPPTMEKVNALPRNVCPNIPVFKKLFGSFNAAKIIAGFKSK